MYVQVRLLKGYTQQLLYCVPAPLQSGLAEGSIVGVTLRGKPQLGVVVEVLKSKPAVAYAVHEVTAVHQLPQDALFHEFLSSLARLYFTDVVSLYARLRHFSFVEEGAEEPLWSAFSQPLPVTLTDEQQLVVEEMSAAIDKGQYAPALLQGVTGSGKTEVYRKLIERALALGKTVLFLCPEVGLARHMSGVLTTYFGESIVFGWHSAVGRSERLQVLQAAMQKRAMVVVGVHLPVLLPLANLGFIVVDEEHDLGYEEKQTPHINSKHAALLRAKQYNVPIILGSATPSVATLHNAQQQKWRHYFLTKRFGGSFPSIEHVLLGKDKKRPNFWVSREFLAALENSIFQGHQAIVYLNRRGYGFFLQCNACGFIPECKECAVSLTLHHDEHAGGYERMLECHYCTARKPAPRSCESCGASIDRSKSRGIGTQQMVEVLQKLLPQARIARADADVSKRKKSWEDTMQRFAAGEIDVLVGTQIITKGFHFPNVALVCIVWADSSVHFPVYNAHEVALQQIIQVAGRAGRASVPGRVIVQSFEDHPLFSFVSEEKYPLFCRQELESRQEFGYPPFVRLATVEVCHEDEQQAAQDAATIKAAILSAEREGVEVLGPARPLRPKRDGVHYWHLLCRAQSYSLLQEALVSVLLIKVKSRTSILIS